MVGRPPKVNTPLFHEIMIKMDDDSTIPFGTLPVLCPVCHSDKVGSYGYQLSKTGIWPKYQCKNPTCPARKYLRKGRQFIGKTSAIFKEALANHLTTLLEPLIRGDTTQTALGAQHHRSPALMTYIRHKVENMLERHQALEQLVCETPLDDAVSLDEMFLSINDEPVYVIMATSYGNRKVLGVKVALSRDEPMMRAVFDEAERNNGKPFSVLTIDAWGSSMKMAKNLNRPIILVIHKHKAPYDKAVIWKITYEAGKRLIHKIGIKTNFFRTRKTREYYYSTEAEDVTILPPKTRGRPKGVKNGQGKGPYVKVPKADQNIRGPKGVFMVFDRGKKGYAHIDPGKKQIRIAQGGSSEVRATLNQVILIYGKMTIQNNLAENKNSVVEHRVWRSGPKDLAGFEKRLRTFLYFLNNPGELSKLRIEHRLRGDLVYDELQTSMYGDIIKQTYRYTHKLIKLEAVN